MAVALLWVSRSFRGPTGRPGWLDLGVGSVEGRRQGSWQGRSRPAVESRVLV